MNLFLSLIILTSKLTDNDRSKAQHGGIYRTAGFICLILFSTGICTASDLRFATTFVNNFWFKQENVHLGSTDWKNHLKLQVF